MASRPQARNILGAAVQTVFLLLLLAVLAGVLLVLFAIVSVVNTPSQVATGVGAQAARVLTGAQQAVQNVTDPNHPPSGLTYDNEFAELHVWHVGERLPDASQYVLSVQAVRRRDGADSPDTAQYAIVHAELRNHTRRVCSASCCIRTPTHTTMWSTKVRRSALGARSIAVNWVSQETAALAAGVYRHPDAVSAPLKFEYD